MIVAVVQARVSSSRLPGKVLLPILGRPMLAVQLERITRARRPDRIVVATSTEPADDAVAAVADAAGVETYRGPLDDVLARVHGASIGADHAVRLTADCPLTDPAMIDRVVDAHLETGADFTSNAWVRTFPDGLDVEVMRTSALALAHFEARLPSEREHVTSFLDQNPERFRLHAVTGAPDLSNLRWVVEREEDLTVVRAVFERLYPVDPAFGMAAVLALAEREPAIFAANAALDPHEGLRRSQARDAASEREGGE
jgi:spore coat polysaccharide biosynthesis protein SpsF